MVIQIQPFQAYNFSHTFFYSNKTLKGFNLSNHRWKPMETISGLSHLLSLLREKFWTLLFLQEYLSLC